MKKNILIYGLILGSVLCINMIFMVNLCYTNPDFESNAFLGYGTMLVILSLIFFGVRNYRNKELNGYISFGKALKTGTIITLISATLYVLVWLIYYYVFVPDFIDVYIPHVLNDAVKGGASATELADLSTDMANFKEMYKNPLFVIMITYFEVLPVGLIVALISALILKKKPKHEPNLVDRS